MVAIISVIGDSVGSSVGSDDVGIPIIPTSTEWWPSKTLAAQLWMIWHQNKDWNGSPKLPIWYGCNEIVVCTYRFFFDKAFICLIVFHFSTNNFLASSGYSAESIVLHLV